MGWAFSRAIGGLGSSWRVRTEGLDVLDGMLADKTPFICAFWHQHYVMLFSMLRGRDVCVFTSVSKQGDVLCRICKSFGMHPVQIPDKGGERSISIMSEAFGERPAAAMAVDGPMGPFHHVKSGVVKLAATHGFLVVPVAAAASWKVVAAHRWDKIVTPLPFSRCGLAVGEPVRVPREVNDEEILHLEDIIHDRLETARVRAEELTR